MIEKEILERKIKFNEEKNLLLKELEERESELIDLIKLEKEHQIIFSKNKEKEMKFEDNLQTINSKANSSIENSKEFFSNFDISEFQDNIKNYYDTYKNTNNSNSSKDYLYTYEKEIINERFNDIYLDKKQRYDVHTRLSLFEIYLNTDLNKNVYLNQNISLDNVFSESPITFYEIFNFKSIIKNDNGLLLNQLILIAKNDTLYAFDLYLNHLGTAYFKEKILTIKTFKNKEGK